MHVRDAARLGFASVLRGLGLSEHARVKGSQP
jgi:hypothetical protein